MIIFPKNFKIPIKKSFNFISSHCTSLYFTFSHLADAFIQSDLQIRKCNQNEKVKL